MNEVSCPKQATAVIHDKIGDFKPKVGLILGSGLGGLADHIEDATSIPFADLPGFPLSSVSGHVGHLVTGYLKGMPVACLRGRVHSYEGVKPEKIKILVRTLKLLGCESLILTNAAGSLDPSIGPGSLMMITDHINFQPSNPLIGQNDDEYGPRFIGMEDAYDVDLRTQILATAKSLNIPLERGVYMAVLGPSFETPAEIKAFSLLGANAVGMSTVPEVIVARHCGLKVAVISAITNLAAGLSEEKITHEGTLYHAQQASHSMTRLITTLMERLS